MSQKYTVNESAKWGLLLGLLMSTSRVYEMSQIMSSSINGYVILSLEWLLSIAVYVAILCFACRGRGLRFTQVIHFSMLISIFAGVIVGVVSHIYIVEVLGGYSSYIARSVSSIMGVMSEVQSAVKAQGLTSVSDGQMINYFNQFMGDSDRLISEAAINKPTIFSSVFSMSTNYVLSGAVLGSIVGLFIRKK